MTTPENDGPNKAVIKKWVDALRSGEFFQTKGALREPEGFCCLGVLCEVAVRDGVIGPANEDEPGIYDYVGETATLPDQVIAWSGLEGSCPKSNYLTGNPVDDTHGWDYYELNDVLHMSFEQIADVIEGQYLQEDT